MQQHQQPLRCAGSGKRPFLFKIKRGYTSQKRYKKTGPSAGQAEQLSWFYSNSCNILKHDGIIFFHQLYLH
jgi:hypothetical protein